METETLEPTIKMPPVKYSVTDAAISELKKQYSGLTLEKDGMDVIHDARMVLVRKRGDVERTRKSLKADSLEYGRQVDAEAKRITSKLEEIEKPLDDIEKAEQRRIEEKKAEEKRLAEHKLNNRIQSLAKYSAAHDVSMLMVMPDSDFDALLQGHKESWEKEQELKLEQERKAKAEAERQEAENKRLREEELKRQKDEAEKLLAERKKLEAEQAEARKKQAELEAANRKEQERIDKERKELEEKQRKIEEEKRIEAAKKTAAEKALQEEKEHKEKELQEAERKARLAPDKDKLLAFANSIRTIKLPEVKNKEAQGGVIEAEKILIHCADSITQIANNL